MNYLIRYSSYDKEGNAIRYNKKMRVKNKQDKLDAQVKLDMYLDRRLPEHHRLVVHDIVEDNDFMDMFGQIFGF